MNLKLNNLKERYAKILITFVLLIGLKGILLGQGLTPVDTSGVWYTNKQDIRCLECLLNEPIKDSLIVDLKGVSNLKDTLIYKQEIIIDNQDKKIEKLKKQKKRSLLAALGLGILTILGFVF